MLAGALACTSEVLTARDDGVTAEVHLHQYERGSHASAGFIEGKVPFRAELVEQLVHFALPPTAREGVCRLDVPSVCEPTCNGESQYCNHGTCEPFTPLRFEDGGTVRVAGSTVGPITLTFDERVRIYRSDRSPLQPLYAGGDRLTIDATGRWPIHAEVVAPAMPSLLTPLIFSEGAFDIRWDTPRSRDNQIHLQLVAVGKTGAAVYINCLDDDRGTLTIPASMMARVPPPPRWLQLEVERRARKTVRVASGGLAVVTVAATLVRDRNE